MKTLLAPTKWYKHSKSLTLSE